MDWGDWEIGEDPRVLYTLHLGACIGIAIYDTSARIGHMAHMYATHSSQDKIIDPLIRSVQEHNVDPSNLLGWITGGSTVKRDPEGHKQGLELRQRVLQQLERLNLPADNFCATWNDESIPTFNMVLDCRTGACQISSRA